MSDLAVATQPLLEHKPLVEQSHVPHENGTAAVAPQAEDTSAAPAAVTSADQQLQTIAPTSTPSDVNKETEQNTEDVDLDIDVESKPESKNQSENKHYEEEEESDSESDSMDLADLDIDLDNIDALDINELQKKQQALLELRNKKQRKLEELLRKQNEQLHVLPQSSETLASQYANQPVGSMSPYPGKRGRGRPRKVPRPGDPEEVLLAQLQQQKLKLQQQIHQQQQQLAHAGVDFSHLNTVHASPDYEKKAKERAQWTLQESRQLLKILESGKTDPQQIWEELSITVGNTKTFDQVKNKKANLMQKASSKSSNIIDVLKDDIVKLEGELFGFSSESDNEAGSFTSSKRRRTTEAGDYYVPGGSPPIVPSSPGLVFGEQTGKRGPGRPRKYARAEDGSVIKQKPLVLSSVDSTPVVGQDIRSFISHKFDEWRAAREEDHRIIYQQRKMLESMQREIKYLKFTNHVLLEKFQIDPTAHEERFKKLIESEQLHEENHSNHSHPSDHSHSQSNTNAAVNSEANTRADVMEEEPKADAMKIE